MVGVPILGQQARHILYSPKQLLRFGQKLLSAILGATFLDLDVPYTGSCPETKHQGSRVPEQDKAKEDGTYKIMLHKILN